MTRNIVTRSAGLSTEKFSREERPLAFWGGQVFPQNSANDHNSGSTPGRFDSLEQPLQQVLDGLNKEGRKAGRQEEDSQQALFRLSCFPYLKSLILSRDFLVRIQGIEACCGLRPSRVV
jgi:hypothetical protein